MFVDHFSGKEPYEAGLEAGILILQLSQNESSDEFTTLVNKHKKQISQKKNFLRFSSSSDYKALLESQINDHREFFRGITEGVLQVH